MSVWLSVQVRIIVASWVMGPPLSISPPPLSRAATPSHRSLPAIITPAVCALMALPCAGVSRVAAAVGDLVVLVPLGCACACRRVQCVMSWLRMRHLLTLTGSVARCAGFNDNGRLGDGTTTSRLFVTFVQGGHTFTHISSGGDHTCGVRTETGVLD